MIDSDLLALSGVSSCRLSGRGEAEMNPRKAVVVEGSTSPETAIAIKAEASHNNKNAIKVIIKQAFISHQGGGVNACSRPRRRL